MHNLSFTVHLFREGDTYVAYVPALDVSSCGATDDAARRNIRDAVRGFGFDVRAIVQAVQFVRNQRAVPTSLEQFRSPYDGGETFMVGSLIGSPVGGKCSSSHARHSGRWRSSSASRAVGSRRTREAVRCIRGAP